jgi:hypothetical protein
MGVEGGGACDLFDDKYFEGKWQCLNQGQPIFYEMVYPGCFFMLAAVSVNQPQHC